MLFCNKKSSQYKFNWITFLFLYEKKMFLMTRAYSPCMEGMHCISSHLAKNIVQ